MKKLLDKVISDFTHGSRTSLDELTAEERKLVLQAAAEIAATGTSKVYDGLVERDYLRKPVTINDFLNDEYYVGEFKNYLYECWRNDLHYVCNPKNGVVEWILQGAIRTGKTVAATLAQMYQVYLLSCLRNPQDYYGLAPHTRIVITFFNVSLREEAQGAFHDFVALCEASPYFQQHFAIYKKDEGAKFPGNIWVFRGSSTYHALGNAVFGGIMDEVNEMRSTELHSAINIYTAVRRRMEGQYSQMGRVPGLLCLVSSTKDNVSFMNHHINEVKDSPRVKISGYAIWEARRQAAYSGKTFKVLVGQGGTKSKVLLSSADATPGAMVLDVPVEHRDAFDLDVDKAIQDLAGISTTGATRLLPYDDVIHRGLASSREHPFSKFMLPSGVSSSASSLWSQLDEAKLIIRDGMGTRPRVNPTALRYLHVDHGLTRDAAGVSCVHLFGEKKVLRVNPDGSVYETMAPKIYVDFIIGLIPVPGDEIDLSQIVNLVLILTRVGYKIESVSFDGYQSAYSVQVLTKSGISASKLSVDKDDAPYVVLRQAFVDDRIDCYYHPVLFEELRNLIHDESRKKVDHPVKYVGVDGQSKKGSKDIADSLAGAVFGAMSRKYELKTAETPPRILPEIPGRRVVDLDESMDWVVGHFKPRREYSFPPKRS